MQHVSDKQYRRTRIGSLTRYAVFTGWRCLCLLTVLLCGVATLAAADTHESGVTPAPVLGDFNGDGRDDVLLRHENGRWFYYPMDGRYHITDQRGYADLTRNLAWQFAGIGDLNGDERDDVLVRHTDGRWFYYPMDGRYHITGERGLAGLTRNLDWHVAGIGDLNGDGKDDVLLRNKNGRWYYYPMNGRRYITDERGYADLTRDLDWQVAGMGDLNGDGRDDVLLRHTDGRWDYYPMDGRNPIADERGLAGLTRNLDWQVAGIGDLNGDGKDDVLLRHTDSRWYYYPMDGRRFLTDARGYAGLTRNLAWQVAGIGDLNGDGRDDVLLRHTDSRWYYYPMDGRRFLTDARGYANLTRNPDWSIAAADTLAPTGAPDLVVQSPSVSASTLNEGESFTFSATVRNQGAGESAATTLRYYRSTDATISSADTEVGTDAVSALIAAATSNESISLTAPSTAGTYYYGVCVETVSGESSTVNNCSSALRVTVAQVSNEDEYARHESLVVVPGGVRWLNHSNYSSTSCIDLTGSTIVDPDGDQYMLVSSMWQTRANSSDAWADVPGTSESGRLCYYDPVEPGEYRFVAELSINGVVGNYSSNILGDRFDLAYANNSPSGITYADGKLYVVDFGDDYVYAYQATGQRDSASDFRLHSGFLFPQGIAFGNDMFYVADYYGTVYAYRVSGQRDSASGFDLDRTMVPRVGSRSPTTGSMWFTIRSLRTMPQGSAIPLPTSTWMPTTAAPEGSHSPTTGSMWLI